MSAELALIAVAMLLVLIALVTDEWAFAVSSTVLMVGALALQSSRHNGRR